MFIADKMLFLLLSAFSLIALSAFALAAGSSSRPSALPPPATKGKMSLEEALFSRRSVRSFLDRPLTAEQIGQLCWSAQGISDPVRNFRTCPSAGALYPLELYVITAQSVSHYLPKEHSLEQVVSGDCRAALQGAALHQACVGDAAAVFVIAADLSRLERKYHQRARQYVYMEAGHAGQNLLLQAVTLGLGAVPVGAFDDAEAARAIHLPRGQDVLYLVPVGYPAK